MARELPAPPVAPAPSTPSNPSTRETRPPWWKRAAAVVLVLVLFGILLVPLVAIIPVPPRTARLSVDFVHRPVTTSGALTNGTAWHAYPEYVIAPALPSEMPHATGNVYAPDVLYEDGVYRLWYGGQSENGHDAIHFATSADGVRWTKYGVVLPTGTANHVNDPSVVRVAGSYFMYYTVAPEAELDQVWCATSPDGLNWTVCGPVLLPNASLAAWDSLKVGRPAVVHENGVFKMWFDGSQADPAAPTRALPGSGRHVGYATSTNGLNWTRWPGNPVVRNSGAVDVEHLAGQYVLVEESRVGVYYHVGSNETSFSPPRLLFANAGGDFDPYGHVTPFILLRDGAWVATYTGAATRTTWDGNRVAVWYPAANLTISRAAPGPVTAAETPCPWAASATRLVWDLENEWVDVPLEVRETAGASVQWRQRLVATSRPTGTSHYFLAPNGTGLLAVAPAPF